MSRNLNIFNFSGRVCHQHILLLTHYFSERELFPVVVFYCATPGECVNISELKVANVSSQAPYMGKLLGR